MKFVRLLIVIGVIAGLLYGVHMLLNGPSGSHGTHSVSQSEMEIHKANIRKQADKIANGWKDEYLDAANRYIDNEKSGLTSAETNTLRDLLTSLFIKGLRDRICSDYTSAMTAAETHSTPDLAADYRGFDKLTEQYPEVKGSANWDYIANLRTTHNDLYRFLSATHRIAPRIDAKVLWTTQPVTMVYYNAFDYDDYASRQRTRRQSLDAKRKAHPELMRAQWTARATDLTRLNDVLADSKRIYINGEAANLKRFASSLISSTANHLAADSDELRKEKRREFVGPAREIHTKLMSLANGPADKVGAKSQIVSTAGQFKRIYIDNI